MRQKLPILRSEWGLRLAEHRDNRYFPYNLTSWSFDQTDLVLILRQSFLSKTLGDFCVVMGT